MRPLHHNPGSRRSRRGIALLVALAVVSMLSVLGVAVLKTASHLAIDGQTRLFDAQAQLTIESLEPALVDWVNHRKTLPNPASGDGSPIDPSEWRTLIDDEHGSARLHVEVVDLSGRLPLWAVAGPDGDSLPTELRARVPSGIGVDSCDVLLEHFACGPLSGSKTVSAFPAMDEAALGDASIAAGGVPVVAADWLNPARSRSVNLRSAPIELLRSVLDGGGVDRSVASEIITRRARGAELPDALIALADSSRQQLLGITPPPPPQATLGGPAPAGQEPNSTAATPPRVSLSGTSDCYGFLVTIQQARSGVPAQRARWWIVVHNGPMPRAPSTAKNPSLAQGRAGWQVVESRRVLTP